MEAQVKKTFLPQDLAVLATVAAAGAACLLLGDGWPGMGVTLLLCWAMVVPFCRRGYRIEGRKGLFRLEEILLSRENKDEILAFLDGKTGSLDLHPWQAGGALVDVYRRRSDGLMLARYFDYADYVRGIEYPLREVSGTQLALLESFANDKK